MNTPNAIDSVDWNCECLGALLCEDGGRYIVRPTLSGQFAVVWCRGSEKEIIKVLPSALRARLYSAKLAGVDLFSN
jgi:hypothetical protein